MSLSYLWINKDAESDHLSQSSRAEEAKIRRHVQGNRHADPWKSSSELKPTTDGHIRHDSFETLQSPGKMRIGKWRVHKPTIKNKAAIGNREQPLLAMHRPSTWGTQQLSPIECRSLAFFESRTCRKWAGWLDFSFWNRIALQLAQTSQPIAHGLISLAALHESWDSVADASHAQGLMEFSVSQGSKAALAAVSADISYIEALASCLILYCLHSLQRSPEAIRLLSSGINILVEYDRARSTNESKGPATPEESLIIENTIRPLFQQLRSKLCKMVDISEACELSILRHRRSEPRIIRSATNSPYVPAHFDGIREARDFLETILVWGHDYVPSLEESAGTLKTFQTSFRSICQTWRRALERTDLMCSTEDVSSLQKARDLLYVSSIFGRVLIETCMVGNETIYDEYQTEFSEMINLTESAMSLAPQSCDVSLGIDSGLIDILAFIGSKCRDPVIRRRAMTLLLQGGRLEGDRVAQTPGLIMKTLFELEEQALETPSCSDISQENRWRVISGRVFHDPPRIRIAFAPDRSLPQTRHEERWISLPNPSVTAPPEHKSDVPDTIFGSGYAEFSVDDEWQRLDTNNEVFSFPIPRA